MYFKFRRLKLSSFVRRAVLLRVKCSAPPPKNWREGVLGEKEEKNVNKRAKNFGYS